jgi:Spy/CpxP family protein refolding chaperone
MQRLLTIPLALGLLGLVAGAATPAGVKTTAAKPAAKAGHHDAFAFAKDVQLTDEQKAKLDELRKEYQPKLDALHTRFEALMTPERRKAMEDAHKKAEAAGQKGKEAHDAVMKALKLSPAEQAKVDQLHAEGQQLMKEIEQHKMALLTDKQREQLKGGKAGVKAKEASKKE